MMGRRFGAIVAVIAMLLVSSMPALAEDTKAPQPRRYTVYTSPTVAGFTFVIEGVGPATTDETGSVTFDLDTIEGIRDRISAITTEIMVDESTRFRFNEFQRFGADGVTAAFNVDYLSSLSFYDRKGDVVDVTEVEEVILRSSVGHVLSVTDPGSFWLHGTRVLSNTTPREIYWTIQDVVVEGASVVNRSEQRITPAVNSHLDVELLMFDLSVVVQSRVLGLSTGDAVELEHPDGTTTRHDLDAGRVTIRSLPRGEYSIVASGAGIGMSLPIALSRDQTVQLHLFSWIEIGLAVAIVLALLALPFIIGVRRKRRQLEREPRPTPAADRLSTGENGGGNS